MQQGRRKQQLLCSEFDRLVFAPGRHNFDVNFPVKASGMTPLMEAGISELKDLDS